MEGKGADTNADQGKRHEVHTAVPGGAGTTPGQVSQGIVDLL
jgi:hypothetical protein